MTTETYGYYSDREIFPNEVLEEVRLDVEWLYGEAVLEGDTPQMIASYREELTAIDDELQRRANA